MPEVCDSARERAAQKDEVKGAEQGVGDVNGGGEGIVNGGGEGTVDGGEGFAENVEKIGKNGEKTAANKARHPEKVIKKPDWLKTNLQGAARGETFAEMQKGYASVARVVEGHRLHTICESGKCPNKAECWSRRTATFMVLGDVCTRSCRFCATATGRPLPIDPREPERVARSVASMGLRHAVITSVTRDDLADGGAAHWAAVVRAVRAECPGTTIELLVPDFGGDFTQLDTVLAARPDIVGHNIETVERLTPGVRSRARYRLSLSVLRHISEWDAGGGQHADSGGIHPAAGGGGVMRASHEFSAAELASQSRIFSKSGIMLGLGETRDEVLQALDDLRQAGVQLVTLGQYLQPTRAHLPVTEYVTPEMFEFYKAEAVARGFSHVASGPLVRSSYLAEQALPSLSRCK